MGSTSTTVGEVVAPTSPAEVSTPLVVRRGEPALVSVTGGEVVTPSTIPHVGVAVRASFAPPPPRPVAQATSCGREMMGQPAPLVVLPPACMAKYFVKIEFR
jgi:hypothetical protein